MISYKIQAKLKTDFMGDFTSWKASGESRNLPFYGIRMLTTVSTEIIPFPRNDRDKFVVILKSYV